MSTTIRGLSIDKTLTQGLLDRLTQSSAVTRDGCRLWTGAQRGTGYGAIKIAGRAVAVHQVSYVLHSGPIPAGQLVRHTCGRRLCIAPDHLILGTDRDNTLDAIAHGSAPGLHHRRTTPREREAVLLLSLGEFSTHEIHRLLGLPLSTVKSIVRKGV